MDPYYFMHVKNDQVMIRRMITMNGDYLPWEDVLPLAPSEQHGTTFDRTAVLHTDPHYSDKVFCETDQSIFGRKEDNILGYVYNDRLQWDSKKWKEACAAMSAFAAEKRQPGGIQPWAILRTAEAHEVLLTAYFGRPVELVHILAGINRSNWFSYLVYGYRFREEAEETEEIEDEETEDDV